MIAAADIRRVDPTANPGLRSLLLAAPICHIQAKRYSKIVGLEAVHALAGLMDHKRAAKGVLVTTSWLGKASRDFAARTDGSRSSRAGI